MPFDLERFVAAQEGVYEGALRELRAGRKSGHWIWFIFPQLVGPRLRECIGAVVATSGATADDIFGSLDAVKVRSSMTLFHRAAPDEALFTDMLERFYGGVADEATDALLS